MSFCTLICIKIFLKIEDNERKDIFCEALMLGIEISIDHLVIFWVGEENFRVTLHTPINFYRVFPILVLDLAELDELD